VLLNILLVIQLEKGKAFRVLNISIKWPDFILVCLSKKVIRITPFPPQTTTATILPIDGTLLNFFFLQTVMWYPPVNFSFTSSTKWCSQVSTCDNLQQEALTSCIISTTKSVVTAFLPLCVYLPAFIPLSEQTP
jgi:hypothetical protein